MTNFTSIEMRVELKRQLCNLSKEECVSILSECIDSHIFELAEETGDWLIEPKDKQGWHEAYLNPNFVQ